MRVPAGAERVYLAPWPIEVLPGAGGQIRARLERLNVRRVGALAGPGAVEGGRVNGAGPVPADLLRTVAADSFVLLRNAGDVLPLGHSDEDAQLLQGHGGIMAAWEKPVRTSPPR